MTRAELLRALGWTAPSDRVSMAVDGEIPEAPADRWRKAREAVDDPPWYLHVAAGFGSFVGAVLFGVFFVFADIDNAFVDGVFAVGLLVAAGLAARLASRPILAEQASWLLVAGGQFLLGRALYEADLLDDNGSMLFFCCVQMVVIAWVPRRSVRVVAAAVAVLLFTGWWIHEVTDFLDIPALVTTVPAVALFLLAGAPRRAGEAGAQTLPAPLGWWRPVAFGIAGAQLVYVVALALAGLERGTTHGQPFFAPAAVSIVFSALGVWTLAKLRSEAGDEVAPKVRPGVLVAGLVLAAITWSEPPILAAFVYLLVAHLRSDRRLEILSLVGLGAYVLRVYFDLSSPLAVRAAWLAATGTLVLALAWWMHRVDPAAGPQPRAVGDGADHASRAEKVFGSRRALALGGALALAVALPAVGIWQMERQIADGRTVLLALRPVDPRAMLLGDYMRLEYEVEPQIWTALSEAQGGDLRDDQTVEGLAVLEVAADGTARFDRLFEDGTELAADEALLAFHRPRLTRFRGGGVDIGIARFYFAEGEGERYSGAQWAEVVLSDDGDAVVVDLLTDLGEPADGG